ESPSAGTPRRGPACACTISLRFHSRGIATSSPAPLPSCAAWQSAMPASGAGQAEAASVMPASLAYAGSDSHIAAPANTGAIRRNDVCATFMRSERPAQVDVPIAAPRAVQRATIAVVRERRAFVGEIARTDAQRGAVGEAVLAVAVEHQP